MYVIERSRRGEEKKNKQFFSNYSSGQGQSASVSFLLVPFLPSNKLLRDDSLASCDILSFRASYRFWPIYNYNYANRFYLFIYIYISRTPILARQPMYNSIAQNRFRFDRGVRLVKASINDIACSDHQVKIEPLKILFWNSFDRLSNYRK